MKASLFKIFKTGIEPSSSHVRSVRTERAAKEVLGEALDEKLKGRTGEESDRDS